MPNGLNGVLDIKGYRMNIWYNILIYLAFDIYIYSEFFLEVLIYFAVQKYVVTREFALIFFFFLVFVLL